MSARLLPGEPLAAVVARWCPEGAVTDLEAVGTSYRQYQRWRAGGRVRFAVADRVATACGLHPAEIWPDHW